MRIARFASALACAAVVALGTAGCGEKPQDAPMKSGKYQGKPDNRPWEGDALAYGTNEFKRGDKTGWETALKTRAQAQNEYTRAQ